MVNTRTIANSLYLQLGICTRETDMYHVLPNIRTWTS